MIHPTSKPENKHRTVGFKRPVLLSIHDENVDQHDEDSKYTDYSESSSQSDSSSSSSSVSSPLEHPIREIEEKKFDATKVILPKSVENDLNMLASTSNMFDKFDWIETEHEMLNDDVDEDLNIADNFIAPF